MSEDEKVAHLMKGIAEDLYQTLLVQNIGTVVTNVLSTAEAIELVKFLVEEIILKHGAPREMISDIGRSFLCYLIKGINQLCQMSHLLTTAYHPQTLWLDGKIQ
ncbi:transposon Ty3-I Gag-Pol polyprotein [Trichonephila clavipes]|uniref:Transposon Ty3-I Gag-Pol polyprotein n=1 Tax=Trichonephila clavipes TaxID=2585209 RepID=A0A8X6WEP4_TRICX|nr:transposon Ty3-I Gag-Pol polyprotein [Trichonephila clavipes]